MNNSKNMRKFKAMTKDEQFEYMATANRVTIGTVSQILNRNFVTSYVAKVRGIIVSNDGKFKFDTVDAARIFGWSILLGWKEEHRQRQQEL